MNTPLFAFFLLILPLAARSADLEIKNGNFEKGKQFWRGDGKVVAVDGGKALELKADDRYGDEISQEIEMGKNTKVEITLRMKGVDYTGDGLRISMRRQAGGSTFSVRSVTNGSWTDLKWTFNRSTPDDKFVLILKPMMGKGTIQIDDVKVSTGGASPNL